MKNVVPPFAGLFFMSPTSVIINPKTNIMQFNWRKLLLDVLKVVAGALAGWLGSGTI